MKDVLKYDVSFEDVRGETVSGQLALHWWKNAYATDLPPRGYVWLVHGLGEHTERYAEYASFLTQWGFDVLGVDFPGHGVSRAWAQSDPANNKAGLRIRRLRDLRACLNQAVDFWFLEGPMKDKGVRGKTWQVLGHSMGALVSLSWILNAKKEGLRSDFAEAALVSAPPLGLRMPVPEWKVSLAGGIHKWAPHFELDNEIDRDFLSFEAANKAEARNCNLGHTSVSPDAFLSLQQEAEAVMAQAADVEIPLALMVGEYDPIVSIDAIEDYYQSLGTHKKYFKVPDSKHEVLCDLKKKEVFAFTMEWFL